MRIPDWAYRDVLFMLTAYSISVFEAIERPLTAAEKEEIVDVFYRMGQRMGIPEVPATYAAWQQARQAHLDNDLVVSDYTADLYRQYRRHLAGALVMDAAGAALVPAHAAHGPRSVGPCLADANQVPGADFGPGRGAEVGAAPSATSAVGNGK
uniref:ER-bound oxygenase mpaB/mpaB'/Rubber oxygenase catalytic domain-containing protein n=1 Tax=Tanacetum cinerariifolium TaxID=118510 RepID=A0A699UIV1_TANCI|nr:hypothetical protein [Tanacetum cinerariifolium]